MWPLWIGLAVLARRRPWIGRLYLAVAIPLAAIWAAGFFTGRLRVDDVCFFLVVWELVSIGAAARVASRSVAKTLPFFTRIIDTLNNSRMQA